MFFFTITFIFSLIQRTKVCRVKLCIGYHGKCTRINSRAINLAKQQRKSHVKVACKRESLVRGNRKRMPPKASTFRLHRELFSCARSARAVRTSRRNPGARMLDPPTRCAPATGRRCDRSADPYARAENKRVTGGSRRSIFGIPTPERRDTRPSAARFSPDGFSVLRSDTRLTLLRSLGFW